MTSDAKRLTNSQNATKSTGPQHEASKEHVRLNALKHSFFARELIIREHDQPEYSALQAMLRRQYAPSTAMQQIAFQRIVCCAWRFKLSIRMEMRRLNTHFDLQTEPGPLVDGMEDKAVAPRWYGWGRAELRAAARTLMELRADIQANGWIHADRWKEPLTTMFSGDEFYNSLSDWSPGNIVAIQAAEYLVKHAELYNMPLPESLTGGDTDRAVIDPRARWEMMVKIVDLKLQQLNDFRRLLDGRGMDGDSESAASVDVGSRYFTTASRDLERAVAWYQYIKQQGL
jgi:hypothetical protein